MTDDLYMRAARQLRTDLEAWAERPRLDGGTLPGVLDLRQMVKRVLLSAAYDADPLAPRYPLPSGEVVLPGGGYTTLDPCRDLPAAEESPLRGYRSLGAEARDGRLLRIFVSPSEPRTIGWYSAPESRWLYLRRPRDGEPFALFRMPSGVEPSGWLPLEPEESSHAERYAALLEWFDSAALRLQAATPDGNNPTGYKGPHPCDCRGFAEDAVETVRAFVAAASGRGPWPDLSTPASRAWDRFEAERLRGEAREAAEITAVAALPTGARFLVTGGARLPDLDVGGHRPARSLIGSVRACVTCGRAADTRPCGRHVSDSQADLAYRGAALLQERDRQRRADRLAGTALFD